MENKYPWKEDVEWKNRTMLIASIIHSGANVLDLGGGYENLRKYINTGELRYKSMDIYKCTPNTIVADFNKNEFPTDIALKNGFDYLVCQGTIEYIECPLNFLSEIKKYGEILIITYRLYEKSPIWRNTYSFEEIKKFIVGSGWNIIFEKRIDKTELLFYCKRV